MIPQVHPVTEPTTILILSEEQEAMSPLVWGVLVPMQTLNGSNSTSVLS